jgi:GTP-binding protein
LVPADTNRSIIEEYGILLNELEQYNPELMQKPRILAVSKSDMLDDELMDEMKRELPAIPTIFISSVAQKGLVELKDMLWKVINDHIAPVEN